jgi:circadian clock protein KaiC
VNEIKTKKRFTSDLGTRSTAELGLAQTGIAGLDSILAGGFPRNRMYLVQGDPGVGKTTLGLKFLLEGLQQGEPGLYVTLSETAEELGSVAASHGWSIDGLAVHELKSLDTATHNDAANTLFHPSEIELQETTQSILEIIERTKPMRIVFDSLSELRLLAQSPLRYRRQILWLKQFFVGRNCTVVLLDDRSSKEGENHLQSLAHGVVLLEQHSPLYGVDRRRMRILKLRGVNFRSGYHDFNIGMGGLQVFPRLIAAEHREPFKFSTVSAGVQEVDEMLGGGLDRGTSILIMGPAGCGKSVLACQYAIAAAQRGDQASLYIFDESLETLSARVRSLGINLKPYLDNGLIKIQQIDPAEMAPGEFVHHVRRSVEIDHARVIVIDSLNGYLNSMPEESFLTVQLHELLSFLRQHGVLAMMVVAQQGLMGHSMSTPVDVSYLADTVIILRYFEAEGEIRKAISVLKKRSGTHETKIREMRIGPVGVRVGEPLQQFHGVLSGIPTYGGKRDPLLKSDGIQA